MNRSRWWEADRQAGQNHKETKLGQKHEQVLMSVDRAIWWWVAGEPGFKYGRLMSWWETGELMQSGGVERTRWNKLDSHTQRRTLDTREEGKKPGTLFKELYMNNNKPIIIWLMDLPDYSSGHVNSLMCYNIISWKIVLLWSDTVATAPLRLCVSFVIYFYTFISFIILSDLRKKRCRKWAGVQNRLWGCTHRPPLPSVLLANVQNLDNKLDDITAWSSSQRYGTATYSASPRHGFPLRSQTTPLNQPISFSRFWINRREEWYTNRGSGRLLL